MYVVAEFADFSSFSLHNASYCLNALDLVLKENMNKMVLKNLLI